MVRSRYVVTDGNSVTYVEPTGQVRARRQEPTDERAVWGRIAAEGGRS